MKYISIVFSCLSLLLVANTMNAQCGELEFGEPEVGPSGYVEVDVIYSNPPSNINSLDISISFDDIATNINFTMTANSVNNGTYTASQGSNSRIVNISNTFPNVVSFTSSTICTIFFKLTKGKDTEITFDSPAVFLVGGIACPPTLPDLTDVTKYNSEPVLLTGLVTKLKTGGGDDVLDDVLIVADAITNPAEDEDDLSNSTGNYSISLTEGESYELFASYDNGNPLCGVSTLDVVTAQRHILGTVPFTDPVIQFIAADVNESNTLTTLDLLEMQRAILGIEDFDRNWALMPFQEYTSLSFPSSLTFDPSLEFNVLTQNTYTEFIGIKGGDVNTSCLVSNALTDPSSEVEYRSTRVFQLGKIEAKNNQEVLIPVLSRNFQHQTLFSLGLKFESSILELIDLIPADLPGLHEDAYTINKDQEGTLDILWFTMLPEGVSLSQNQILFYIKAKLKQEIRGFYNLRRLVQLQRNRVDNSIYDTSIHGENIDIETGTRQALVIDSPNLPVYNPEYELRSFPNPFTDEIQLQFIADNQENTVLKLVNLNGRVVRKKSVEVFRGSNNLQFSNLGMLPPGQYTYQIILSDRVISGKVIK